MTSTAQRSQGRLILFAPGIHTGGGFTLLRGLLAADALKRTPTHLLLDVRALPRLQLPAGAEVSPIAASLSGRLAAERSLRRQARAGDTVLCLHSLPPLFRLPATTVCFHQNLLLLNRFRLGDYPLRARLRLTAERWFGRRLRAHVDRYAVQTPSMRQALAAWHRGSPEILVCPFMPAAETDAAGPSAEPEFDFVYVSDGLAHKNHRHLLEAWRLLAEAGHRPSLCLTLSARDRALLGELTALARRHNLRIENRGDLSHPQVEALYRASRALIFPSYLESFGLPLVEADRLGLPILAPERDYVRDVCRPAETFDPDSPRSIARAVRRFLSVEEAPVAPRSADRFLTTLLSSPLGERPESGP